MSVIAHLASALLWRGSQRARPLYTWLQVPVGRAGLQGAVKAWVFVEGRGLSLAPMQRMVSLVFREPVWSHQPRVFGLLPSAASVLHLFPSSSNLCLSSKGEQNQHLHNDRLNLNHTNHHKPEKRGPSASFGPVSSRKWLALDGALSRTSLTLGSSPSGRTLPVGKVQLFSVLPVLWWPRVCLTELARQN